MLLNCSVEQSGEEELEEWAGRVVWCCACLMTTKRKA